MGHFQIAGDSYRTYHRKTLRFSRSLKIYKQKIHIFVFTFYQSIGKNGGYKAQDFHPRTLLMRMGLSGEWDRAAYFYTAYCIYSAEIRRGWYWNSGKIIPFCLIEKMAEITLIFSIFSKKIFQRFYDIFKLIIKAERKISVW